MERRLAAILAADVVGFSRLMEADEAGTLAALKKHRSELVDIKISEHLGRIVKTTGDGLLVEFPSVVSAVDCAVRIQQQMRIRNVNVPANRRIDFRIGINLGDVIVDEGDIFGDGVNIAARLEAIAEPSGIAVSESVVQHVGNRLDVDFDDMGERSLKNLGRPVRVHSVRFDGAPYQKPQMVTAATGRTEGRIAVLPFANISGDPDQDYFAEGIAEDILTELSRFRNLFVIARNSSFSFKGKGMGTTEIARQLNVEYIVSGSVRRAGSRVRVAAQLVNTSTGQEVWAERYDREVEDIFAVQDEVVRTIVSTLESRLRLSIASLAGTRNAPNLAAYECAHLARKHLAKHDVSRAMPYLERALELDPDYAYAYAYLSSAHYVNFLENSKQESLEKMEESARKAVQLDSGDSTAHSHLGMALTFKRQYKLAGFHLTRAMSLNPADMDAAAYFAEWLVREGDAARGLAVMDDAVLRDPIPPPWHWEIRGLALLILGNYEDAILSFSRQQKQFWYVHAYLAVCYALLGDQAQAADEIAKVNLAEPNMTIGRYSELDAFRRPEDQEFMAKGLRLAGLPE